MLRLRRYIIAFFIIIICFILQTTVFQWISFGGIVPNILLIIVICYGLMQGEYAGIFVGFISGLLIDIFFAPFIGLDAFIYMVIGYLCGKFHRLFVPEDVKLPLIMVTLGDLLYSFTYYVFMFLLRGRFNLSFYFGKIILPELVYTLLISLGVYPLLLLLHIKLDRHDEERGMKFV